MQCHVGEPCQESCETLIENQCTCGRIKALFKCSELVPIECDSECKRLIRNSILAKALSIKEKDAPECDQKPFQDSFISYAQRNINFILEIEEAFEQFIQSNSFEFRFKPMKAGYRQAIHELSEYYNLLCYSVDAEPKRSCIIARNPKLNPCIPTFKLSEVSKNPELNPAKKEESLDPCPYNSIVLAISSIDEEMILNTLKEIDDSVEWSIK
ncbi:hypothetical protein ROZALSC1DRAFT_28737 [Rozella allomycis CSF55]|uniref:R3H domain-containing protein n=1 Tax=Rozella allomycis (strain CSF55) TaxID=988480 RepID=A0A4P9YKM0_ROZAC|nr:hypothetical protein ROZALSC1DRAFT_28737 [Rozella allomycis CSF55]